MQIVQSVEFSYSFYTKFILLHATTHAKKSNGNQFKGFSTWIRILQWIVQTIAVAVEVLAVVRHLYIVVRTEKAAENGVIQPSVTFPALRQ